MRRLPLCLICLLFTAISICGCNHTDSPTPSTKSLDSEAQATAERIRDLIYRHCPDGWRSSVQAEHGQTFGEVQVSTDARLDALSAEDLNYKFEGYEWFGDAIIGAYRTAGHPPSKSGLSYEIYKRGEVWYYKPSDRDKPEIRVDDLRSIAPSCEN